jgi:hypothetical protein
MCPAPLFTGVLIRGILRTSRVRRVRMQDPALPRSYRARITMLEPRYRFFLYPRVRRYNRGARVKRSSACQM